MSSGTTERPLFRYPQCGCGHGIDDHNAARSFSPMASTHCLARDCDCSRFERASDDEPKAAA